MEGMKFQVDGISDAGILGKINDDSYLCRVGENQEGDSGLFAVADGVGGLGNGYLASGWLIEGLDWWWKMEFPKVLEDEIQIEGSFRNLIQILNDDIRRKSGENNIKVGTTLSVLLVHRTKYYIFHVGDSRIYKTKIRINGGMELLTQDHSCTVEKKNSGGGSVYKKVLTECVGYNRNVKVYCDKKKLETGDIFLLCSDGLYKTVDERTMYRMVKHNNKTFHKLCCNLVLQAKDNMETDNITVIALRICK